MQLLNEKENKKRGKALKIIDQWIKELEECELKNKEGEKDKFDNNPNPKKP